MAKFAVFLIFIVLGISQILAAREDTKAGTLIYSTRRRSGRSLIPPPVEAVTTAPPGTTIVEIDDACPENIRGKKDFKCNNADECSANGFHACEVNPITFICPSTKPFCKEDATTGQAKCTDEVPKKADGTDCDPPKPDFNCMQEGIMPDPLDCRKYYFCYTETATGILLAESYICDEGYFFDPALLITTPYNPCKLRENNMAYCITSACKDDYGFMLLKYPTLTATLGEIGVQCLGKSKPQVHRCGPNSKLEYISYGDVKCNFDCKIEGQMGPYPSESNKYYLCIRDIKTRALKAELKKCMGNQKFNPDILRCA